MPKKIIFLCVLLLAIWFPGRSQFATRVVTGVVTDARGNALPKAVVQLENRANLAIRSYITGADGRYRFNEVSFDIDYTLTARYRTHWSKPRTLSEFSSAAHPEIKLVIPIE